MAEMEVILIKQVKYQGQGVGAPSFQRQEYFLYWRSTKGHCRV